MKHHQVKFQLKWPISIINMTNTKGMDSYILYSCILQGL